MTNLAITSQNKRIWIDIDAASEAHMEPESESEPQRWIIGLAGEDLRAIPLAPPPARLPRMKFLDLGAQLVGNLPVHVPWTASHSVPSISQAADDPDFARDIWIPLSDFPTGSWALGTTITPERSQEVSGAAAWLEEALQDLAEIDQEAEEEQYPPVSDNAKHHAKRILEELAACDYQLPSPSVYPTADGEVAIMFRSRPSQAAVVVLSDSQGRGECYSTFAGSNRRAVFDDASELPDEFVRSQLKKLSAVM